MRQFFLITLMFAAGCSAHVGPGWRTFDAGGRFRVDLPKEMERTTMHGIDSYVRRFEGRSMSLEFEYGLYAPGPVGLSPDRLDLLIAKDTVDGVPIEVGWWYQLTLTPDSLPYRIQMNTVESRIMLGMYVHCRSPEHYTTAWGIFRSIRFPKDRKNREWHKDGWVK